MLAWALLAVLPAVTVSKIQLVENGRILTTAEIATFVNAARCSCDSTIEIAFDVTTANEEGELVVAHGKRCIDSEMRLSDSCEILWRGSLSGLRMVEFEVAVSEIAGCSSESSTDALLVLADPTDEDTWAELTKLELPIDTKAPAAPENAKVLGGEELVEVVFERPTSEEKIQYQVLCDKAGEPLLSQPPDAAFISAQDLCGEGEEILSKKFVCAEASGGTDSVTVQGLENGQTYRFYVVTIDLFGNPSAVVDAGEATPAPELDLWEVYRKNGGSADGGHCFVATAAFGDYDHPQVVLLREFRDRTLSESELGRSLIALYYRYSPPLAKWVARSKLRRDVARLLLWPITIVAAGLTP
jgi:hypothetical protein